jgi:pimeloyl-ACP methyl ester carboxylesterase
LDRRTFIIAPAAAAVLANVQGAEAAEAGGAQPPLAGVGTDWVGGAALRGGKGYAACPLGQLHYRRMGPSGAAPILLLHQTPLGMAEYIDVQPALARAGRGSIAVDNPGFGLSDPPPPGPLTIAVLADNLVGLLDALALPKVVVAGHHTGSAFAAAFAARHPTRTAALVLHGCPFYTPTERAERLARPVATPKLEQDGSHFTEAFRTIRGHIGPGPEFVSSATWAVMGQFMSGADTRVYRAVFANDMAMDIAAITTPTLVLTDRSDTLHENDKRVVALRPDFTLHEFSTEGSFALMHSPGQWAQKVADFAADRGV